MSLWFGGREPREKRATFDDILSQINTATAGWAKVSGGSIGNAQQSVAVRSSVDLIASICSELPIDVYTGKGSKRKEISLPTYLEDPAGDGYGLSDWIYQLVYAWLYRGNAYGEPLDVTAPTASNPKGMIRQMSWFHPDRVTGQIIEGRVQWSADGVRVPRLEHRRVNPVPGQILGLSPIEAHADTVGVSLAATRFGKSWFDSDAQPVGILRNSLGGIDPDKAKTVKDRFMAALKGNREPVVMGRGWEFQTLSVSPEESQFLGTMGYTEAQCARIFGPGIAQLLGYEVGGSLTYANIQDFDITLLKYSVGKWLRRLERVLFDFLPRPQYAIFNRDALLETSTMQRYQAHALALQNQPWKEINEVREKENLPPLVVQAPPPETAPTEDEPADQEEEEPA